MLKKKKKGKRKRKQRSRFETRSKSPSQLPATLSFGVTITLHFFGIICALSTTDSPPCFGC